MKDKKTEECIIAHYIRYPALEERDLFKFLFHSAMGCDHLVSSLSGAIEYIKREYAPSFQNNGVTVEDLDGDYCRIHLSALDNGLTPETLAKLFFLSAKKEEKGREELINKLGVARRLILNGDLPLDVKEFDRLLEEWKSAGFPAVRHSDAFREKYEPSYRVVAKKYIPFLRLLTEIDKRLNEGRTIVAIEGGSASGKTTLAETLREIYGCTVFHADDFFLRPEQRTPERLSEVGGNLDRERLLSQVLEPLSRGENVNYVRFNCRTMSLEDGTEIIPKKLTVIEGAYSMHPELEECYDLSVFLDISRELQEKRIKKRNSPEFARRFFDEWIPLEDKYFDETKVKERCDLVINIG